MRRLMSFLILVSVFAEGAAFAQTTSQSARRASTTKRVVWTIVGAGAGFGAGLFLGLNKFDDSINSDRKVWTSAIVGAAAGGLAGGLLSANRKREASAIGAGNTFSGSRSRIPQTLADVANPKPIWTLAGR
jgi:hypothetical protein